MTVYHLHLIKSEAQGTRGTIPSMLSPLNGALGGGKVVWMGI